jgi:hypothetical protein
VQVYRPLHRQFHWTVFELSVNIASAKGALLRRRLKLFPQQVMGTPVGARAMIRRTRSSLDYRGGLH